MTSREELIEAVTREVLAAFGEQVDEICVDGSCAVHSPDKVRETYDRIRAALQQPSSLGPEKPAIAAQREEHQLVVTRGRSIQW